MLGFKGDKVTRVPRLKGLLRDRVFSRTHLRSSLTPEEGPSCLMLFLFDPSISPAATGQLDNYKRIYFHDQQNNLLVFSMDMDMDWTYMCSEILGAYIIGSTV